ncbi:YHYH protein [uncultured Shewanella sp.]|uniref:YHYH protein n=1 Tax=uncultured Shewanella sp. TaxID=173975 RepID=UPI002624819A|nr:YHYH protein [uncultured Shewanella sp.]
MNIPFLFTLIAGLSVGSQGVVFAQNIDATNTLSVNPSPVVKAKYFQHIEGVPSPKVVDCQLTDGTNTQCLTLYSKALPDHLQIGPFCPENINEQGGIWEWDGEDPGLYRLNGAFFKKLNALGYRFYDESGNLFITTPGGAAPQVRQSAHACLEAKLETHVKTTTLIPLYPKQAKQVTDLGTVAKVGLALDGIPVFADAPSVLQTGQLPALDECGGHVDPGGYYHWHGTSTDIDSSFKHEGVHAHCHLSQSHSALFAFAFDGFPMYGSAEEDGKLAQGLDECNGHFGPTKAFPNGIYHYHASLTFPNLPKCLKGVQAKDNFKTTAKIGIGSQGNKASAGHGRGQRPDLGKAAQTLGVSEMALRQALGGPPPNFQQAAEKLKVSVSQLQKALGHS